MMFVSYSRSDIIATRAVVEALSMEGIECWFDQSNIPVGQAFVELLGTALRQADSFLLVDTPSSRSSYWVAREMQTSSRYRREGRYHSNVRVYSPDCEQANATTWDASMFLSPSAPTHIAKFLAGRHTARLSPDLGGELGSVSIINSTGLGQPSNWTGRQDELRALDAWWFGSLPGAWLNGLGGSGKSGLLQTWITALFYFGYGDPVSASVLYLRGSEVEVTETQCTLNTWEPRVASTRLLVVDGHDEARSTPDVEKILAQAIHLGARVLVTSRTTVPPPLSMYFISLHLGGMTRRDSVAILNQFGVTGPESEELAAELGDHPLALLLLSRSLVNGNKSAVDALIDLRGILGDGSAGRFDASRSIRVLIRDSVRGLSSDAKVLLETLCRTAEVERPGSADPAIRELASAGLVQVDHLETPSRVSIHPLVREHMNQEQSATLDGR
jgi:hypothetical protein